MNTNTRTYEIEMSKGYSGKAAAFEKGWIAKITGSDEKYGLKRVFLKGKPTTDAPYRKAKCQWIEAYELAEGAYEVLEGGERTFVLVWLGDDGAMKCGKTTAERVKLIADLLDCGVDFAAAKVATTQQVA
jgi:hypothetical protein